MGMPQGKHKPIHPFIWKAQRMSKEVAKTQSTSLIPETTLQAVIALDNTIKEARQQVIAAEQSDSPTLKALVLSNAMNSIRDQLTPMMPDMMRLMGTTLGFKTDRDDKPKNEQYSMEKVRDCILVGLIRGFQIVNNELNIIAGNFYGAKNGYYRLVTEYPGLEDLRIDRGVPSSIGDKGALVPMFASWELNGVPDAMVCDIKRNDKGEAVGDSRIPVRVNAGMGTDGIIGKAERKLYCRIYERLTNTPQQSADDVIDGDLSDVIDATATQTTTSSSTSAGDTQSSDVEAWLITIHARFNELAKAEDKIPVKQLYDDSCGPESPFELTPDQHARVEKWRDAAYASIESRRGENSNQPKTEQKPAKGKQKTMAGVS
jgi:hypothetical protein